MSRSSLKLLSHFSICLIMTAGLARAQETTDTQQQALVGILSDPYFEAEYGAYGSLTAGMALPLDVGPSSGYPDVLSPRKSLGTAQHGGEFMSPLNAQSVYSDPIRSSRLPSDSDNKLRDFAERWEWLQCSNTAGLLNVISRQGGTRPDNNRVHFESSKLAIGAVQTGATTAGAPTDANRLTITGHLAVSASAFDDISGEHDDHGGTNSSPLIEQYSTYDWKHPDKTMYWRWSVLQLIGGDIVAECSDRIAAAVGDHLIGPVDGRTFDTRESEYWDPQPAVVRWICGTLNTAFIDNGPGGKIRNAYGQRTVVASVVRDSWVDVLFVNLLQTNLGNRNQNTIEAPAEVPLCGGAEFPEGPTGDPRGGEGYTLVGDSVGIEVLSPRYAGGSTIATKTGVLIEDQVPDSGGGAPLQVAQLIPAGVRPSGAPAISSLSVERVAGIINRGATVFSPPELDSAVSGVVHVRDILHLQPRTTPPQFQLDDASHDSLKEAMLRYSGVMYFDLNQNALMVSRREKITGTEDDYQLNWRKVLVEQETAVAVETLPAPTSTPPPYDEPGTLQEIASGDSLSITPRIKVRRLVENFHTHVGYANVMFFEGFGQAPQMDATHSCPIEVYWRRVGYGMDDRGPTEWADLSPSLTPYDPSGPDEEGFGLRMPERTYFESTLGADGEGGLPLQALQFMALQPTTLEPAGCSLSTQDLGPHDGGDDSPSAAKTIIVDGDMLTEDINPDTDEDWFQFTITSTTNIHVETDGPPGGDTLLYLYGDDATTLLTWDDDSGIDLYSLTSSPSLPAATYYLKVTSYNSAATIMRYTLRAHSY